MDICATETEVLSGYGVKERNIEGQMGVDFCQNYRNGFGREVRGRTTA